MTEKLYMVLATYQNSIRNNIEVVDYNLTKEQAESLKTDLNLEQENGEIDEDWLIDVSIHGDLEIKIMEQNERM